MAISDDAAPKPSSLQPVSTISKRPAQKPLERVLSVLQRQEPDRVPHFEWVHYGGLVRKLTQGGTYFDLVEQFDLDGVMVNAVYRKTPLDAGIFRDEWGVVRQIGHDDYGMADDSRAPLRTADDVGRWQVPDPSEDFRYHDIRAAVDRFGGERAIILQARDVWSVPRDCMGYMELFINLIEAPEMVDEVVRRSVDHYIQVIRRGAEVGVNVVFTGDDVADARGPMFAPSIWENLFIPHYRRLVAAIHDAGLYHWKHSDGNLYPLLDSIVASGTDGIDPIDPMGGMELSVVKAKYGDRVAIKGNVDQTDVLINGPAPRVVSAVKRCIRDGAPGGGYVCSSSNSIHEGVDPELYRVMVEAIHTYGQYPLDMDMLMQEE